MKDYLITLIFVLVSLPVLSQNSDRDYIRRGNRYYRDSIFDKAQILYKKAVEANPSSSQAHYNLGNAYFALGNADEALKEFQQALKLEDNKARRAMIHHNMGVLYQAKKQLPQAIDSYKQALRIDPHNDETRYNYILCLRQLKNQPPQDQQQQQQDDKEKKDQDKEKEQEKPNPDKSEPKDENEKEPPQPQSPQLSKENAEQLLKAAMQNERNTQEKIKRAQQDPAGRRLKKQW